MAAGRESFGTPVPGEEKKSGWYQEEGGWRYYLGNTGEPVRNDWHRSGEDWYWFDGAGFMVYNDWKRGSDGTWYYLKENGEILAKELGMKLVYPKKRDKIQNFLSFFIHKTILFSI